MKVKICWIDNIDHHEEIKEIEIEEREVVNE